MRLRFEKNLRIACDLLTLCHTLGATDYKMDLSTKDGCTQFIIRANILHLKPGALSEMNESLSVPRQHEIEQNYWALSSEVESAELTLVGMMLDNVTIEHANGMLTITASRFD